MQVTLIFSRLLRYLSYVHTVRWLCTAASVFSRGNNMSLDNQNYLLMSSGLFTLKIHKIRQLTATVRLTGKNKQEKSALQNARLLVIIMDSGLYYCHNIVFKNTERIKRKLSYCSPTGNTKPKISCLLRVWQT